MNKRQRELLINICEKVAVYGITAGLVGRFLNQGISSPDLIGLGGVSLTLMIVGYRIAKGFE